jgi:hypothetical protein
MTVRCFVLSIGSAFTTGVATTSCAEGQLRLKERTFVNGLQAFGCGPVGAFEFTVNAPTGYTLGYSIVTDITD